ncbi:MAG: CDP-glycerol glycerophosphotransferase family protein [Clostridia bacterium]|nr:CDP-glycerol glycerophosphotransferase family protein [Clostridia bacterium]
MLYVRNITWERIHLNLDLEIVPNPEEEDPISADRSAVKYYLTKITKLAGEVKSEFKVVSVEGNRIRLSVNVTNNGVNRCFTNGTYKIIAASEGQILEIALYDGTSEQLAAWCRSFNYFTNKGVYTVSFMVDEYAEEPELQILIYNARTGKYSDKAIVGTVKAKKNPFRKIIRKLKKKYRSWAKKTQTKLYKLVRRRYKNKKRKHILFLSEKSETLALNMNAVYNRMLERGLDKEYAIDLSLRVPSVKKYSKLSTLKMTALIGKASVILVDDHVPLFDRLLLDPSTTLIQVWHAGAGFKGVGYSRWGHYGCPGLFCAHRQYTYCISGSSAISHFFSEQFGILDEQIIPTGMPRMDAYLDPKNREAVTAQLYETYPMLKDRTVVLFAPTYRGRDMAHATYPYKIIDFDGLYDYCQKKNAVVLFKMHPWVAESVPIREEHADRFLDMNAYPNINDLFYVTDLLITDYSSSMYEFLLMKKPMLLFPYDKNQYATSRGFHRDYDSNVPGKICMTFEELLTAMRNEDYEFEKVEKMLGTYFETVDTNSCDRVIDWLVLGHLPETYREALDRRKAEIEAARSTLFIWNPDDFAEAEDNSDAGDSSDMEPPSNFSE